MATFLGSLVLIALCVLVPDRYRMSAAQSCRLVGREKATEMSEERGLTDCESFWLCTMEKLEAELSPCLVKLKCRLQSKTSLGGDVRRLASQIPSLF